MEVNLRIEGQSPIPAIIGRKVKIGSWEFVWWGFIQMHKWRWHRSHIDLGALSVYGFRYNHWLWRIVACLIKPLRGAYHRQFIKPQLPTDGVLLAQSKN